MRESWIEELIDGGAPLSNDTRVNGISFDRNGILWGNVSRVQHALFNFSPANSTFNIFDISEAIPEPEYYSENLGYSDIVIDNSGNVYFGSYEYGVIGYQPSSNTFAKVVGGENQGNLSDDYITTLALDNNNQLWAGTTDGLCIENMGAEGSWLIHNTNTKFYSNNITQIKHNPNNNMIAIGTMNGGLVTYSDDLFNIYYSTNSDILDNSILDVTFDNNNNVIMCTPQAGMGVFTQNGSWIWFNTINSELPTNSLKNVVVDSNNNLWITTLEDGLIQYKNNTFYTYNTENSDLPDNQINTISICVDTILWGI